MERLGKPSKLLAVLFTSAGLAGCVFAPHKATLTEAQVLAIANQEALLAHVDLSKYHSPEAHFEYVQKNYTWAVFYDGIRPAPGNHFMVVVNDKTQGAELVGGL